MKFTANKSNVEYLSRFLLDLNIDLADISISVNNDQFKRLIESPYWPQAVLPTLIVDQNNEQAKTARAQSILNSFVTLQAITNKKFLDFGCGEGHLVKLAKTHAKLAIGYDLNVSGDNLTSNIDVIRSNAPYDVIVMYDVLDHVQSYEERRRCINIMLELLTPGGVGIVRIHPFSSRHASHVYQTFNKAYAHLVYTHQEMAELGYNPEPVLKTIRPLKTYRELWQAMGLKVISESIIKHPIEDFFTVPDIFQFFIDKHWHVDKEVSNNKQWLTDILSIQFVDYKLSK